MKILKNLQNVLSSFSAVWPGIEQDIDGPKLSSNAFPAPTNPRADAAFRRTLKGFDQSLTSRLARLDAGDNTSYSIHLFVGSEHNPIYEKYHASDLVSSSTIGTNRVDGDSIYRICSISKVLTVYTFLIQEGDRRLNDVVADHLPELRSTSTQSSVVQPKWDEISLADLASHLSGVGRDYGVNDLSVHQSPILSGYPHLHIHPSHAIKERPVCGFQDASGAYITCSRSTYLQDVASGAAVFSASFTPAYCNSGFVFFAMALERMTNMTFEDLFAQNLVRPLKLQHTCYNNPSPALLSHGVIPGNTSASGWDHFFGPFASAGGNYMSAKDLSTLGRSILRGELLSKTQIRRWLKPQSLLSDPLQALGMPWEIQRIPIGPRLVDLYAKSGDWAAYHTQFTLAPEFDFGYSILTASDSMQLKRSAGVAVIREVEAEIARTILPAFEDLAKRQAERAFAGTFSSSDPVEHTITVAIDRQVSLKIVEWIHNGTDMLRELSRPFRERTHSIDFRLQPNDLYSGREVGFTAVVLADWSIVDMFRFANVGLDQFVFALDQNGVAHSLRASALRNALGRK